MGFARTNTSPTHTGYPTASSSPTEFVNLFSEDGVAIPCNPSGVVKTWDISTGRYRSLSNCGSRNLTYTHPANGGLIAVWESGWGNIISGTREKVDSPERSDIRMLENGSKGFSL